MKLTLPLGLDFSKNRIGYIYENYPYEVRSVFRKFEFAEVTKMNSFVNGHNLYSSGWFLINPVRLEK